MMGSPDSNKRSITFGLRAHPPHEAVDEKSGVYKKTYFLHKP